MKKGQVYYKIVHAPNSDHFSFNELDALTKWERQKKLWEEEKKKKYNWKKGKFTKHCMDKARAKKHLFLLLW